jgi:hypothetical protein
LEQCHELHIRWSAPVDHALPAPFISRLPAGLHVFFTPLKAGAEVNLCPLLQKLFGAELKCSSTTESFTQPSQVSETFSSSASYQYFQVLPSLSHFNQYLQANAWHTDLKARIACENEAEFATYAASLDVDYDAISHAVGLSAAWSADADALGSKWVSCRARKRMRSRSFRWEGTLLFWESTISLVCFHSCTKGAT